MTVGCENCALCGKAMREPVKAHIIAKGLLALNTSTQHSFACIDAMGGIKRRLDGLFIKKKTCRDCEEKIFTPLDNCAVQTFRERRGSALAEESEEVKTYRLDGCNRQNLRAYFASLIWRFALAKKELLEAENVDLGEWLSIGKGDLLNWERVKFEYIDALCIEVRSSDADSFGVPQKMLIGKDVLGFMLDIPHWRFYISVGCKCHPFVEKLFEDGFVQAPLYSLSSSFDEFPFCYHSVDFLSDRFNSLIDAIVAFNRNNTNCRKVYIE